MPASVSRPPPEGAGPPRRRRGPIARIASWLRWWWEQSVEIAAWTGAGLSSMEGSWPGTWGMPGHPLYPTALPAAGPPAPEGEGDEPLPSAPPVGIFPHEL